MIGEPTAHPSVGYHFFRLLFGFIARSLFRVHVEGLENLPRDEQGHLKGGWICAGMPHRTWIEPLALVGILPARPRLTMMADAPTAVGSWWRRLLVGWVGGVVLVPRRAGARFGGFGEHVVAVGRVLRAGAVFSIFPESGPPSRPPEFRRVSVGVARIAQQTGAVILPVVFGGSHDLYLRRRLVIHFLAPIAPPPPEADRDAIDAYMADLLARAQAAAAEAHRLAQSAPPRRKLLRWLHGPFARTG